MRFSDKELGNYVSRKLALPGDERNEYREQVNRLLEKLEAVLHEDGSYRIQKFRRAGSLEKGTSNKPRAGKAVDADVGVYFDVDDPSSFDIAHLQQLIKKLLAAAYPQKSEDDFDDTGARTFGVVFQGTGLEIDLVPIVSLDAAANYGFQYSRAGDCVKTSVKVHIDHYRDHAGRDPHLSSTLRMAKRWRHWQELDGIQSFHLELMLSYLVDRDGAATTLEESLRRLFRFIARDLHLGVAFDGADVSGFTASRQPESGRRVGVRSIRSAAKSAADGSLLTCASGMPPAAARSPLIGGSAMASDSARDARSGTGASVSDHSAPSATPPFSLGMTASSP